MTYDTPEKMQKRKEELERKDIDRLMALYRKKYKEQDFSGADKIAFILSSKHGIEGDRSYQMGSSDFEG